MSTSCLAGTLCLGVNLLPCTVAAHPMEYHLAPLDSVTVERVIDSLEGMARALRGAGFRLPDSNLGVAALGAALEDTLRLLQAQQPPAVAAPAEVLLAAGYTDPLVGQLSWQLDAERVLESYEVLARGLDAAAVDGAFIAFAEASENMPQETALHQEMRLLRDAELVRTTRNDIATVTPYRSRLDALVRSLGVQP
ncbi:hypothetical protein DWB85_17645 [Seongchinamella sediminis]|uniref:Uncharacterized protein n=2 Tax=Seongchinamella sediminis TaxID=2283635 RepID=A0A3L7DTM6_9GAMM|nr:hypothetical protein DWB85_17645 [Seongchinamella sediminis]